MTATPFSARAYFVCSDARTGSNLLAGLLRRTKIAGRPYEYFSAQEIEKPWMRDVLEVPDDVPYRDYRGWRDYILHTGSRPGGVFGCSLHWVQLENAVSAFSAEPLTPGAPLERPIEALRAFFPELRLVRLSRRNLVAQAISHYVAIKSGEWMRHAERAPGKTAPTFEEIRRLAPYDYAAIDWQVLSARVALDGWTAALAGHEDITMPLTYEELQADSARAIRKVLAHLGLDLGAEPAPSPVLEKQATPWSRELERLYRFEYRARGRGAVGDEEAIALAG